MEKDLAYGIGNGSPASADVVCELTPNPMRHARDRWEAIGSRPPLYIAVTVNTIAMTV